MVPRNHAVSLSVIRQLGPDTTTKPTVNHVGDGGTFYASGANASS